jgi:membrane-anchored protein YejM (alkaline phosphatase superfamily)
LTQEEVDLIKSGGINQRYKENKAHLMLGLRKRVTNDMLNLDSDTGKWLDDIHAYLNNTVLILTGDHSELLFDTDGNFQGHTVNTFLLSSHRITALGV